MDARATSGSARDGRPTDDNKSHQPHPLVAAMAAALRIGRVDLDDERAVYRVLLAVGYQHGDVISMADQAVAAARTAQA